MSDTPCCSPETTPCCAPAAAAAAPAAAAEGSLPERAERGGFVTLPLAAVTSFLGSALAAVAARGGCCAGGTGCC